MAKNNINVTLITVVAIIALALVLIVVFGTGVMNNSDKKTITASETYTLTATADLVSVNIQVLTKSDKAETAKNENSRISENVINSLNALGIEKYETLSYNVYPEYDWSTGNQKLTGYSVSNNLRVKLADFDQVGKVVDASVNAGALVNSIDFELSEEKQAQYQTLALANASEGTMRKAKAIAEGVGKSVGDLVSISASEFNYRPYPVFQAGAEDSSSKVDVASVQVASRDLEVSAYVEAVYSIR